MNNSTYRRCSNIEFSRQLSLRNSITMKRPYFFDSLRCQFGRTISSLKSHVDSVVRISSFEQMIRIYARRIIATVKNSNTFWNRTIVNFPGNPMGSYWSPRRSVHNLAVPLRCGCDPQPAIRSFFYVLPESFFRGVDFSCGMIFSHWEPPVLFAIPRTFNDVAGISMGGIIACH